MVDFAVNDFAFIAKRMSELAQENEPKAFGFWYKSEACWLVMRDTKLERCGGREPTTFPTQEKAEATLKELGGTASVIVKRYLPE